MGAPRAVHALSRVIDDTWESPPLGSGAGVLTAALGFVAGLPITSVAEAASFRMPFVTVAAGLAGWSFAVLALGVAASE
jgi:hypothetical protein